MLLYRVMLFLLWLLIRQTEGNIREARGGGLITHSWGNCGSFVFLCLLLLPDRLKTYNNNQWKQWLSLVNNSPFNAVFIMWQKSKLLWWRGSATILLTQGLSVNWKRKGGRNDCRSIFLITWDFPLVFALVLFGLTASIFSVCSNQLQYNSDRIEKQLTETSPGGNSTAQQSTYVG